MPNGGLADDVIYAKIVDSKHTVCVFAATDNSTWKASMSDKGVWSNWTRKCKGYKF